MNLIYLKWKMKIIRLLYFPNSITFVIIINLTKIYIYKINIYTE